MTWFFAACAILALVLQGLRTWWQWKDHRDRRPPIVTPDVMIGDQPFTIGLGRVSGHLVGRTAESCSGVCPGSCHDGNDSASDKMLEWQVRDPS